MASVLGEVTVEPVPPDVVARIQLTVPPVPPLTVALNATCPPTHKLVGLQVLVAQVGSATTVTVNVLLVTDPHPLPVHVLTQR